MQKITRGSAILIFTLLFSVSFSCFAQEDNLVTLEEAIALALNENNNLKANVFAFEKAEWDVKNAWSYLLPTVTFNTRYTWIDDSTFAQRDFRQQLPPELAENIPQTGFQESYVSSFDVAMPIFNARLYNAIRIANRSENAAEKKLNSAKQKTVFEVVKAYLDALKAIEFRETKEEYLELSGKNLEKAKRQFEAGVYSRNEVLRAQVDYQQQLSDLKSAQTQYKLALVNLNRLINFDMNNDTKVNRKMPVVLSKAANLMKIKEDGELFDLLGMSDSKLIEMNYELGSAYDVREVSRLNYEGSYASYMPDISLAYQHAWRENNTIDFDDYSPKTFMVNFSIPIFSGFQNYTKLRTNLAEYRSNEENFEEQKKNTRFMLTDVVTRIINLKAQLELAETNVELSKSNFNIVEQRRERGITSNLEYLDAKLAYQDARINNINVKYDFVTAVIELKYLLGKINEIL